IIDDLTHLVDKTDDSIRNETRRVKLVETKSASCGQSVECESFTLAQFAQGNARQHRYGKGCIIVLGDLAVTDRSRAGSRKVSPPHASFRWSCPHGARADAGGDRPASYSHRSGRRVACVAEEDAVITDLC
ncbi:hypothetical protein KUCAC02_015849, partial [Chaenocephalus aceratus]